MTDDYHQQVSELTNTFGLPEPRVSMLMEMVAAFKEYPRLVSQCKKDDLQIIADTHEVTFVFHRKGSMLALTGILSEGKTLDLYVDKEQSYRFKKGASRLVLKPGNNNLLTKR